ncbi:hypothetical protein [Brevibacterium moorei]|uniref:hypothetical protein n=1 Tax=Brevibacterium moorei TaxID=2968457 RepID=UPI00211BFBCD|nr:hypothetical protein [Brevibacterium sp. 68QC2CO]MCQ9385118.1 hypothetical protein [Brevibacterium sp. 68QC2CO]
MAKGLYPTMGQPMALGKGILDEWFSHVDAEVHIGTKIPADFSKVLPYIMVRTAHTSGVEGTFTNDPRFTRQTMIEFQTFTEGLNAEAEGFRLQESIRQAVLWAHETQYVVPGAGSISKITGSGDIRRVSDYATSTGVVQYASLPKGAARIEQNFRIRVRPAKGGPENQYLPTL